MDVKEKTLFNYIKYSNYGPHYLTGLEIFKKYPIFGSGMKTFRIECRNVDIKNYYTTPNLLNNNSTDLIYNNKCNTHPHQIYFEILSELGLIGFLLFFSWNIERNNWPYRINRMFFKTIWNISFCKISINSSFIVFIIIWKSKNLFTSF